MNSSVKPVTGGVRRFHRLASVLGAALALLSIGAAITLAQNNTSSQNTGQNGAQDGQGQSNGGGRGRGGRGGGGGGGRWSTPEEMMQRLLENDANGDGILQYDEVPEHMRDRFFERWDTNKDNVLDAAEMRQMQTIMAEAMQRRQAERGNQDARQRGGPGGPRAGRGGGLGQIDRALAALKTSKFGADTRDVDLQAVMDLQIAIIAARGGIDNFELTSYAKTRFGEDKASFEKALRRSLMDTSSAAQRLETAIADGSSVVAANTVTEVENLQKKTYGLFREPETAQAQNGRGV